MPEAPDNIVVIYEYEGDPYDPYAGFANRSIQICVRDVKTSNAAKKCRDIFKLFISDNLMVQLTVSRSCQVHLRDTPVKQYQDTSDRAIFGFSLGITTTID